MRIDTLRGPSKGAGKEPIEPEETCFICSEKEDLRPRTVGLHDIMVCELHGKTIDRCCDELGNGLRYVGGKPPMKKEETWDL